MTTGLSGDGAELLATLVGANAQMAAHTANLLLEGKNAEVKDLASGLVNLVEGLMKMPAMSRPAYIDHLLARNGGVISHAYRVLDKSQS